MSAVSIFWFALTGLVFAVWGAQMLYSLFRLLRAALARAEARAGMWPTIPEQLSVFRDFLTDPAYRNDRQRLLVLTLLMFTVIAGHLAVFPRP